MAAYNRRMERANLLRTLGPCCKALCARRDIAIRRQLLKNDKVLLWSLIGGTSFVKLGLCETVLIKGSPFWNYLPSQDFQGINERI